jgi:hypothetical protein
MAQCKHCKGVVSPRAKTCPHCGEPNPGRMCFIATAAYGTPMAPEIDVLRTWRDESLIKTMPGRLFINVYYTVSPPIARGISKSEPMRAATRKLINPLVKIFDQSMRNN